MKRSLSDAQMWTLREHFDRAVENGQVRVFGARDGHTAPQLKVTDIDYVAEGEAPAVIELTAVAA